MLELYDIKSVISIYIKWLTAYLIYQNFLVVKLFFAFRAVAFDHLSHRLVVIPAHLLIRHPAIALGCSDVGVAQKVLDSHQISIGVEHLGGHGVPKLVAGDLKAGLVRVVFHAMLDTANVQWLASKASLFDQKEPFGP